MSWLGKFLCSTIGQKFVMAVSGLMLVGFVVAHMLGNLQVFLGREALNDYAALLQGNQGLLWVARIGLIGAVAAHIWSAFKLTMASRRARPVTYKKRSWFDERYAVRTMRVGGVILLAFIVYHILHLTLGVVHDTYRPCADVSGVFTCYAYDNLVSGLANPLVGAFYVVAQVFLGLHLTHGFWSMTRTLGQGNPRFDKPARTIASVLGVIITIGNCSIPVAIMAGIVS